MAIAQYIFETPEGQWWINHDGKRHGPARMAVVPIDNDH
jgi:hypothetical protein